VIARARLSLKDTTMARLLGCIALLVALTWTGAAFAQGGAASFSGRLLNPSGEVLQQLDQQKVAVNMKDAATGKAYSAPVTAKGDFAMTLPAGSYDLAVPMTGSMFLSFDRKAVAVTAGGLKMDISLAWGLNLGTIADDPAALSNDLRARAKYVDGPTPRLPDGKPDLAGIWWNIPDASTRPTPPMKPWALDIDAQMKKIRAAEGAQLSAGAFCLPMVATPTTLMHGYKFVQAPTEIVQLTEALVEGWRQIFTDGRPHPPADEWNPSWYGHSIGKWEGDTLVVDTVGFNENATGYAIHSEKLHVVERITRPTVGKIHVDITADDAEAWTGPFHFVVEAGLVTGEDIQETICTENNTNVHFSGGGWRARP
jgi:hypothetical protein